MERTEIRAQLICANIKDEIRDVDDIIAQERLHESWLTNLIDDRHLAYVGAFFRGMYIAIVQITGVLAGLNLALHNSSLVALVALAIGVTTGLTMGGVGYLNNQIERRKTHRKETLWNQLKNPLTTCGANIVIVVILVSPFLLMQGYVALSVSVLISLIVIVIFAFYTAIIQDYSFVKICLQMIVISAITAVLSFVAANFLSLIPHS